jgi:hypothetical protein
MMQQNPYPVFRGSRKHVLDWVGKPSFPADINELLNPLPATVEGSSWMPKSYDLPAEARLETFGPSTLPKGVDWEALWTWWLRHRRGATTPNWDLASNCLIEGRRGLLLVEAKANWPELSGAGKPLAKQASPRSVENHAQIAAAISSACDAWRAHDDSVTISRDSHYQLSNRLAFCWKLSTLGIPIVLMYLGFTGDSGIMDAGQPFADRDDWTRAFSNHIRSFFPETLLEKRISFGGAPVWVISRSRVVIESSEPRRQPPSSSQLMTRALMAWEHENMP